MSATVTALYDSRDEATRALRALKLQASLLDAGIYDPTPDGSEALRRLDLAADERAACEEKLASGDYLLLARVDSDADAERVIAMLERIGEDDSGAAQWTPLPEATAAREDGAAVIAEERLPLVEEELHVGTREVVRGGARVRTRVEELPVTQEIELLEEFARVSTRPVSRAVSAQELEQAGLLRDRVVEIAQVREEAVVTKQAFVREEVVVSKTVERRVEHIDEMVRRTEVETEDLGAGGGGGR